MAIKLPSFKVFSTRDTKSRVFILFAVIIIIVVAIFFVVQYFGSGQTVGGSRVAPPPSLQSIPGEPLTSEYARTLRASNTQAAEQAQMTGGSAIPTQINVSTPETIQPQQNCTILCPSADTVDVANSINDLVKGGKLPQKDADILLNMAKNNVPVEEYAAELDRLVREGKLTPEQARKLLEEYKKQHQNVTLSDGAKIMDGLIKSGQLPLDTATQLLALQKSGISPADYAEELNRLVREGKISQQVAAQLLGQYTQQQAREATKRGVFQIKQLARSGAITPEVANQLATLIEKNMPCDQYSSTLQQFVSQGKMTPAVASKLTDECQVRRAALGGGAGMLEAMIKQQEILCQNDLNKQKQQQQQQQQGNQNPQPLPPSCQKLNDLKAQAQRLLALQANNATAGAYAEELKRAVQAGLISPEEAGRLMQYYEAMITPVAGTGPAVSTTLPTSEDFARLQQAVQNVAPVATTTVTAPSAQFSAAEAQAEQQAALDRAQRVQQLQSAMSNQAQSLVAAWQPPRMAHFAGNAESKAPPGSGAESERQAKGSGGEKGKAGSESSERPLIKAGTIMFGVLDTGVNSDYPDTPVLVTIVSGPYKGAKLLGKLALAQGQDRVSLNFNLMDRDDWPKTKNVSAFAIDPDTARTVMASSVDHHYWLRYGSLFASSFLTGYANGITNAGTTTNILGGTSTTHPDLSPGKNFAVALGQVGTAFTSVAQSYVNTPATVVVNAGVGLGILFMADVT